MVYKVVISCVREADAVAHDRIFIVQTRANNLTALGEAAARALHTVDVFEMPIVRSVELLEGVEILLPEAV